MLKPFYKNKNQASVVEVEDHGIIDLRELPIKLNYEDGGSYEINWVKIYSSDKTNGEEVLSEYGGKSRMSFGGRNLGVIKIIN